MEETKYKDLCRATWPRHRFPKYLTATHWKRAAMGDIWWRAYLFNKLNGLSLRRPAVMRRVYELRRQDAAESTQQVSPLYKRIQEDQLLASTRYFGVWSHDGITFVSQPLTTLKAALHWVVRQKGRALMGLLPKLRSYSGDHDLKPKSPQGSNEFGS